MRLILIHDEIARKIPSATGHVDPPLRIYNPFGSRFLGGEILYESTERILLWLRQQ